ncbi:hypothetical protein SEVIR_9G219555v4 [Setaria viridis]
MCACSLDPASQGHRWPGVAPPPPFRLASHVKWAGTVPVHRATAPAAGTAPWGSARVNGKAAILSVWHHPSHPARARYLLLFRFRTNLLLFSATSRRSTRRRCLLKKRGAAGRPAGSPSRGVQFGRHVVGCRRRAAACMLHP